MIAAIYARKSRDQNITDEENSVARQIARAREYAERKGWTVVDERLSMKCTVSRTGSALAMTCGAVSSSASWLAASSTGIATGRFATVTRAVTYSARSRAAMAIAVSPSDSISWDLPRRRHTNRD